MKVSLFYAFIGILIVVAILGFVASFDEMPRRVLVGETIGITGSLDCMGDLCELNKLDLVKLSG